MTEAPSNANTGLDALLLHHEVEQFLYREAYLLDEWRLDEWLELFTDDARYVVPTTDLPEGDPSGTWSLLMTIVLSCKGG